MLCILLACFVLLGAQQPLPLQLAAAQPACQCIQLIISSASYFICTCRVCIVLEQYACICLQGMYCLEMVVTAETLRVFVMLF